MTGDPRRAAPGGRQARRAEALECANWATSTFKDIGFWYTDGDVRRRQVFRRSEPAHSCRPARGPRGHERGGEDHAHEAAAAPVRHPGGAHPRGRPEHRRRHAAVAAPSDRLRAAGGAAVPPLHRGEHRLRTARRHDGGDSRGGPGRRTRSSSSSGLPQGFDTITGERGIKLLGRSAPAHRHRAGAMLADCPILVLDEATSALDSESEAARAGRARARSCEGRTAIVVAHRLSTVASLDRIVVLSQGTHRGGRPPRRARGQAAATTPASGTAKPAPSRGSRGWFSRSCGDWQAIRRRICGE